MEARAVISYIEEGTEAEGETGAAPPRSNPALEAHAYEMRKVLRRVFHKELLTGAALPQIKWTECERAPGAFSIYLLCSGQLARENHLFFQEMVSHWLVNQDRLPILSSRNLLFQRAKSKGPLYYFAELLIHVEKEQHLPFIRQNLPTLADEIKLGLLSTPYARHILETKCLTLGGKTSHVYETIVKLTKRHPKLFEQNIFRSIQHFFVHMREEFCSLRSVRHLSRIIATHYFFQKSLAHDCKILPHKRHLYFKLFKTPLYYPFGLKKVLGLAISLNSLDDCERFDQRHIAKAVQRILPQANVVSDSFYAHRDDESKSLALYIEFEKVGEGDFNLTELKRLRKMLSQELKNSIEYLSPSLFIPRNEEELYRNILNLSQELKFVHDLPQAMISFKEQQSHSLKFEIILLRLLHKEDTSLHARSGLLPLHVRFIPEKIANVGLLRKKHIKEANVFALEIESRLFLRKNHSVDLIKARQYVVKLIEKLVGNFRDYNGGFLLKQNEQLEAIKKELGDIGTENEFHLENLFYSLAPSIMQTLLPPRLGRELFTLFLKTLEVELSSQKSWHIEKKIENEGLLITVKIDSVEIKETLSQFLKEFKAEPLKFGASFVEIEGRYYAALLLLTHDPKEHASLLEGLSQTLHAWMEKKNNLQFLRLYLPRAAQSLDPRIGADRTSGIVLKMLFEGLMRLDIDGKLEPAIAERVVISEDGLTYLFSLRKTFWSNGTPLTAFDFEYAWKKILAPDFHSPYSFLFFMIKNAALAKKGELPVEKVGVYAHNDYELRIELEYPAPFFLGLTAHWTYSPLCQEIDQRHPGWAYHNAESYVCNGPFKLSLWKLNDDLEVIPNPLYWDASQVKMGKIEIRIIEDESRSLKMFLQGELDWFGEPILRISPQGLSQIKSPIIESTQAGFFWLQLNADKLPFRSVSMRKAFAYAIDREHIIRDILKSNDYPALALYRSETKPMLPLIKDANFVQAIELFEEGLTELGLTRKTLPPIIFTHSDIEEHEYITHEIGKTWEKTFGIKVRYERLLWNAYFEALSKQDYMVGGITWYSRYEDPMYYLDLLAQHEDSAQVTSWKNAQFEKLLFQAKRTLDPHKREHLLREAEKVAIEQMPIIPLFFLRWRFAKNPRLKNVILSDMGQMDFRLSYIQNQAENHEKKSSF